MLASSFPLRRSKPPRLLKVTARSFRAAFPSPTRPGSEITRQALRSRSCPQLRSGRSPTTWLYVATSVNRSCSMTYPALGVWFGSDQMPNFCARSASECSRSSSCCSGSSIVSPASMRVISSITCPSDLEPAGAPTQVRWPPVSACNSTSAFAPTCLLSLNRGSRFSYRSGSAAAHFMSRAPMVSGACGDKERNVTGGQSPVERLRCGGDKRSRPRRWPALSESEAGRAYLPSPAAAVPGTGAARCS